MGYLSQAYKIEFTNYILIKQGNIRQLHFKLCLMHLKVYICSGKSIKFKIMILFVLAVSMATCSETGILPHPCVPVSEQYTYSKHKHE